MHQENVFSDGLWALLQVMLILSFAGYVVPSKANSFYVDSQKGNDDWTGMAEKPLADGSNGPWRTLNRLSRARLRPGDRVYLHCRSYWRESLSLNSKGKLGAYITIQKYGNACSSNDRPRIDSAMPIEGWRKIGSNIYAVNVNTSVKQVFVDGTYLPRARFPKNGWLQVKNQPEEFRNPWDRSMIYDPVLAEFSNRGVNGINVRIQTKPWLIEERTITGNKDQGIITLDQPLRYPVKKGTQYYLLGALWMLTYPGAWVYDGNKRVLYIRLSDDSNPSGHNVELSFRDNAIKLNDSEYLKISGISVAHSKLDGILIASGNNIHLQDLAVFDSGRDGIHVIGTGRIFIERSNVQRSIRDGIHVRNASDVFIIGNQLIDSGTVGPPINSLAAINVDKAKPVTVKGNKVTNSGYIGIRFKRNAKIIGNTVKDSCQVLHDCGAIYSWANNDSFPPFDSEVKENLIEGTSKSMMNSPYPPGASGIYLDDLSNGIKVVDNRVSGCDRGIHLHNAFNIKVISNELDNNRRSQVYLSIGHPQVGGTKLVNNVFLKNIMRYGLESLGVEIVSRYPTIRHAEFDRDEYIIDGTESVAFETERPGRETVSPHLFTIDRWQEMRGQELNGKAHVKWRKAKYSSAMPRIRSDFSRDLQGWIAWSPDRKGKIFWNNSCEKLNGGCMELNPGPRIVVAHSRAVAIRAGENCELKLKIRSDSMDTPLQVRVRHSTPPFPSIGLATQLLAGSKWQEYILSFTANQLAVGTAEIELKTIFGSNSQVAYTSIYCQ